MMVAGRDSGAARRRRERRLRSAWRRCGPGSCVAPQRPAGRRSTEPEDSHQGQGGRGPREAPWPKCTEATSPGDAAGAS